MKEIGAFEGESLRSLKANYPEILIKIREEKAISEETDKELSAFYEAFVTEFSEAKEAA